LTGSCPHGCVVGFFLAIFGKIRYNTLAFDNRDSGWKKITEVQTYGTNVFVNPAKRDRETDQETAHGTWLYRKGCAERYGI
jgi:hypothetical protein